MTAWLFGDRAVFVCGDVVACPLPVATPAFLPDFSPVIAAKAGIQCLCTVDGNVHGWTDMRLPKDPAFAGMTD